MLKFDSEIDELVARRATVREVTKVAKSKGFVTIAEDGVRRVVQGVTSLDEVSRVIDLTDRLG